MRPLRLEANQPVRFYRGGEAIARFRGVPPHGDRVPEDWVGSTTTILGAAPAGLTTLADGRLLRDAVAADPERFLGPEHVAAFGAEPRLLVKLLDAGERLPVHLHPDAAFARAHLGAPNGKNEAWLVLAADGPGAVLHVGFREDVDAATLADWFDRQDTAGMLAAMNEVAVAPGDCVFVPAGTAHAIGAGIFMVEAQEPSDLGVMLEWQGFLPEASATMGLATDVALAAGRRRALPRDELAGWIRRSADAPDLRPGARAVVPPAAEPFFRAEWLRPEPAVELEPSWSILVVVAGAGRLATADGDLDVTRGDTLLVPHAAGTVELAGELEAIRCLPPRPRETT